MRTDTVLALASARARRGTGITRLLVFALILVAPIWAGSESTGATPVDRGLVSATESRKFSLVGWMAGANTERLARTMLAPSASASDGREAVREYLRLTGELQTIDSRARGVAATEPDGETRRVRLAGIALDKAALASQRERVRAAAEQTIAGQIESVLAEQRIRDRAVSAGFGPRFPFVGIYVRPGVAFRLGESPDALIVSPRDRIEVIRSVLLRPDTSVADAENIEDATDRLDVSSIVTRTGGLAAYPAMVVPNTSLRELLTAISHEWTHHYLLFTNLGSRYFDSYDMRTLNETAADIVGQELGSITYSRYYEQTASAPISAGPTPSPRAPPGESFGALMGSIRLQVEEYLRRGDVPDAERYMAEQRLSLVARGYQVRKLNTAYLSFFGSYSSGENPFERKLRLLRERSDSLAAFMETVSTMGTPSDLDVLLARAR